VAVCTMGLRREKKGVVGLLCVKSMGDSCVVCLPVRYENLLAVRSVLGYSHSRWKLDLIS
jgi:hypothetical protein